MNFFSPQRGERESASWRWLAMFYVLTMWLFTGGAITLLAMAAVKNFEQPPVWAKMFEELAGFIPFFIAALTVPLIYRRTLLSGVSSALHFRWNRYGLGIASWAGINAIGVLFSFVTEPEQLTFHFEAATFFPALAVGLLLLPIQTGAEEIFFRGVIPQMLSKLLKSPWIVIAITSAIFAALHLSNPEAQESLILAFITFFVMGAGFGYIAYISGGLEIVLGAHFINNLSGLFVVGYDNSVIQGAPLWSVPAADLAASAVSTSILIVLWSVLVRRLIKN
mgnify:CR=1 FL=1